MKPDTLALLFAVVSLALEGPLWLTLALLVIAFITSFGVRERQP